MEELMDAEAPGKGSAKATRTREEKTQAKKHAVDNHFVKGKKKGTPAKTAKPDKKAKATAGKQTGKRDAKEHGSSDLQTDPVRNACHVRHRTAATRANMGPTPKKLRQASGLDIDGGIVTTSLSSDDDSGVCVRLGTFFSGMETPSIALTQLGMRSQLMFAVESEPALLSYIKKKYKPLHLCDDVNKVDDASLPAVDLFVGGPPCQSFARGGKVQGLEDTRGCLIFKMVESLEKTIGARQTPSQRCGYRELEVDSLLLPQARVPATEASLDGARVQSPRGCHEHCRAWTAAGHQQSTISMKPACTCVMKRTPAT